jgi:hypothetical protein
MSECIKERERRKKEWVVNKNIVEKGSVKKGKMSDENKSKNPHVDLLNV